MRDIWDSELKYRAPIAGHYTIKSTVIRHIPTGKFETVPNENYRWYTPWRPKTITREIMEVVVERSGNELIYAKAGDLIELGAVRLGGPT